MSLSSRKPDHRIAIVGMACRLPGAEDLQGLWQLLSGGVEAIGDAPGDRAGEFERGGFLDAVEQFDAGFFGISPKEAQAMDPQQRLALELAWESLEDCGLVPDGLPTATVGVYLGVMNSEYADIASHASRGAISHHSLPGLGRAAIANRISHVLGFHGPGFTVDTGQSSSLAAVHLACESLRTGESELALAGGVNLILSPHGSVLAAEFGALSPDGRCYAFDARANGHVRGEGGGIVVLKRLPAALESGDRIYGVINGSALGSGTGETLTLPSHDAQARVIREALARGEVRPMEVQYVELHGTGTAVGDPIEAAALGSAYGRAHANRAPLAVGSIKTNIGHLEGAAGIAGLIKTALCLHHGELVASLNFAVPNAQIPLEELRLRVVSERERWPRADDLLRAGVSSFGMGGANCHLILEEAPVLDEAGPIPALAPAPASVAWMLSGRSGAGLRAQAERLRERVVAASELGPVDVAFSLAGRAGFEDRAVVVGRNRGELVEGLGALARGESAGGVVRGRAGSAGSVAFVFPGQGSQWAGMAVGLLESSAVFAERIAACAHALSPFVDWSLEGLLRGVADAPSLDRVDVVQPALFAVMVSLAELWRSYGVEPSVVVGHSQGEIAAAHVAGALSLSDAARVVALRSRALAGLAGRGGMVSVFLPAAEVAKLVERWDGRISLAAFNGPRSVVVSGETDALEDLVGWCEQHEIRARTIPVDYASHSSHIEAIRDQLAEALAPIRPVQGQIPLYSTAANDVFDGSELDAGYWYRSLRDPVGFEGATRALIADGVGAFIEVSSHPVLTMAVQETVEESSADAAQVAVIGSLRRDDGGLQRFTTSLAELHVHGHSVDWRAHYAQAGGRRVDLPPYAFQRERFWLQGAGRVGDLSAAGLEDPGHPLLGAAVELPGGEGWIFTGRLSLASHAWLADHGVFGSVVLPASALAELALHAGGRAGCERLEELTVQAPLVVSKDGAALVQVSVGPADELSARALTVSSRDDREGGEWVRHASGRLSSATTCETAELVEWPPAGAEPLDPAEVVYQRLAERGFDYGHMFQGLGAAWRLGGQIYAEISLPEASEAERYVIHPALLDACVHPLIEAFAASLPTDTIPLPCSFERFIVHRPGASELRVVVEHRGEQTLRLSAFDEDGQPILDIESMAMTAIDADRLSLERPSDSLFALNWTAIPLVSGGGAAGASLAVIGKLPIPGAHAARNLRALTDSRDETNAETKLVFAELSCKKADPAAATHVLTERGLSLVQEWLAEPRFENARLVILTRGAVSVADGEPPNLAHAALWGLLRSAQAEHPECFALVDLDASDASLKALPAAALAGEPQLALRAGVALVPRLAPAADAEGTPRQPLLDPERTVLISGSGELARELARHLASAHGARKLLLVSRRGPKADGAQALRAELAPLGAEVEIAACDLSKREQLHALLDTIPAEHPLGLVVHTAAILDDGTIPTLSGPRLKAALRPKVDGAWNVHLLTESLGDCRFVLFSSAGCSIGTPGQGNYAAANAFLDALAQHRRTQGMHAVSIAWGPWANEGGLGGALEGPALARLARAGLGVLSREHAVELFDAALTHKRSVLLAARLDRRMLSTQARDGRLPALLRGLVRAPARRTQGSSSLARRLAAVAAEERAAIVLELVRSEAAAILGHSSPQAIEPNRAFTDIGFDSVTSVELSNHLRAATGLRVPTTLTFNHTTPTAVATFLRSQIDGIAHAHRPTRARARAEEQIAIVGMACRYPGGVRSARELWELVAAGRDAIGAFPADRGWDLERLFDPNPQRPGTSYSRQGGFLYDAALFDNEFFGISPREALAMDPQQRLLLEVCWEALEHGEINPLSLEGSDTTVYAGITHQAYGPASAQRHGVEGYRFTGTGASLASGRPSYVLGLHGPAVSLDTACSSSLVALHDACRALRAGESSLALAGGVTVLPTPEIFIEFSRQGGLADDGHCKAFADAADGVSWGEGVGMLVLQPLLQAERAGRAILAIIRGSATNHDGRSNGLTAPNGPSQERVIREALAAAGLTAAEVDAVEAHGTGTVLGDPIEAQALLATYGAERTNGPLRLGSLKSNIGHAQAAAGVGGVIKIVEALREETLPATLHIDQPSTQVDWSAGEIELLTEAAEWRRNGRPRRAGVSSFGISGTNAHMVLEEAPPQSDEQPTKPAVPLTVLAWPLSGRSPAGLQAHASHLREHLLARPSVEPIDVSFSLASRARLEHRATVTGSSREALLDGLAAIGSGKPARGIAVGVASEGKTAFMFTGQGAQRPGMGAELYETFPAFAEALDAACAGLDPLLGRSLRDLMFAPKKSDEAALLDRTEFTQPALFALEVALYRLSEWLGINADSLVGHSIGEISAAHCAGVFSLEDACRLVAARAQLMGALPADGGMLAVEASEPDVARALAGRGSSVAIAAINGPRALVISGRRHALEDLEAQFAAEGRRTKRLTVSHAFHSPLIDPMLDQLRATARELRYGQLRIPIISTVTAETLTDQQASDPSYWVSQAREPVRFADAVANLSSHGTTRFVELGPDAVLCAAASASIAEERDATLAPLLRGDRAELDALTTALAIADCAGTTVDWRSLFTEAGGRRVDLPPYAFQRQRYWLDPQTATGDLVSAGLRDAEHPLLSASVELPEGAGWLFTSRLSLAAHPWLAEHRVLGSALLAGTAFADLALHAGARAGLDGLAELTVHAPLMLPDDGGVTLQVMVGSASDGARPITISSRSEQDGSDWVRNATGELTSEAVIATTEPLGQWPPPDAQPLDPADVVYQRLADHGFDYGRAFQGLRAAWRRGEEIFAEIALEQNEAADAERYEVHPALLDACLHAALLATLERDDQTVPLPFSLNQIAVHARGASAIRARINLAETGLSLTAFDGAGEPVVEIGWLGWRRVDPTRVWLGAHKPPLYALDWTPVSPISPNGAASPAIATVGALTIPGAARFADLTEFVASVKAQDAAPGAVFVELVAESGLGAVAGAHELTRRALQLIQQWLAEPQLGEARLVFVTRRGVATSEDDDVDLTQAPICGLLRSVQAEHPDRVLMVDLDDSEASLATLPRLIGSGEPQLALRAGAIFAPRLIRQAGTVEASRPTFDPDRTVLISGGTGGLGGLLARHLASAHGVRRLLLLSRRGNEAAGANELRAELEQLGAKVEIAACDLGDEQQLRDVLAHVDSQHPLSVVIHAAGVLDDGTTQTLSAEKLERVLRPKVDGAWHLHELTHEHPLDALILYSSITATIGGAGQGNYAAANAFLDALAQHRHRQGLPAISLAWGLWSHDGGMAARLSNTDLARMRRSGLAPLSDAEGLRLFDAALAAGRALTYPARFDTASLSARATDGTLFGPLRALAPARTAAIHAGGGKLAARLQSLPDRDRQAALLDLVLEEAAAVLGHQSSADVAPEQAFTDIGSDSLTSVELSNGLAAATGLRLPKTIIYDYPTPAALAAYLHVQIHGDAQATPTPRPTPTPTRPELTFGEPIAIVGMACRYPGGVRSPKELWELVASGRDAISEFPTDRGWDLDRLFDPDQERPGTCYCRHGGFLYDAADFDNEFFGINPREAVAMDPQQRLLLEVCWEAVEHGRIDARTLHGTRTAVYAGIMHHDYGPSPASVPLPDGTEGYLVTGLAGSVASGRVSHELGLRGPALTLDTACSSSLVALHHGCQALRLGECSLALAGGSTVLATPRTFTEFARQGGLALDGRCKSFAEAADGVGWGEGVGVLVLERLSDAQRNGHPVLAVVRGSAVNHDGASNGLTAPNGPSQEQVIRDALEQAGLAPADVDVVEGHGTGTALGDPIEAGALLATYGRGRENGPLLLASVKSNIGHTQAAAGVAGIIKLVEGMNQEQLPATLHVDAPSSNVDWAAGDIALLTESVPWRRNGRPRRAGVSSFGISGTNAHAILEEPPQPEPLNGRDPGGDEQTRATALPLSGMIAWPLSAKSEPALRATAERLLAHVEADQDLLATDIGFSLVRTRTLFDRRAVVLGSDRAQVHEQLRMLARGGRSDVVEGSVRRGKLAYMFTGQGAQRAEMGAALYARSPLFAVAFDEVCGQFDRQLRQPLADVVFGRHSDAGTLIDHTELTQPALFAIEVALYRLLEGLGMAPDIMVGHSIGEIAAVHCAGTLTLEDATKLVAARGRLMGQLPAGGGMLAIEATEAEAAQAIAGREMEVSIATINGPRAVVISGASEALDDLERRLADEGRRTKRLNVSHAFHSPLMTPMLEEFEGLARDLHYSDPTIPIASTVTGEILTGEQACDPAYWVRQAREAVRFSDAFVHAVNRGVRCFIELGPDGVLCAAAAASLPGDIDATLVPVLRDGRPEPETLLAALAAAHVTGATVDWARLYPAAKPVALPTYPFQRQRHWLTSTAAPASATTIGQEPAEHPLLDAAVELPDGEGWVFTGHLSLASHAWLADHDVFGSVLLPGTAFVELALYGGVRAGLEQLEELTLQAPLVLAQDSGVLMQLIIGRADDQGRRPVTISSRPERSGSDWVRHATGSLATTNAADEAAELREWPPAGALPIDPAEVVYQRLAQRGFDYGPAFQNLARAWRLGDQVFAEITLSDSTTGAGYGIHPALLDAAFHTGLDGALGTEGTHALLPFAWRGVRVHLWGASSLRTRVTLREGTFALAAYDEAGSPTVTVESVTVRPVEPQEMRASSTTGSLFKVTWTEIALPERSLDDEPPSGLVSLLPLELPGLEIERHESLEDLCGAITDDERLELVFVTLPAGDGVDPAAEASSMTEDVLELVQATLAATRLADTRLVIVTQRAVATAVGEEIDPAQAAVWGLLRSAQSEHPDRFAVVDTDSSEASVGALYAAAIAEEPQIALRGGTALAPRLAPISAYNDVQTPLDPDRTILITGGTGGLGRLLARHLVSAHNARRLLLLSRRGTEAAGADRLRNELDALGAHVEIRACDASDSAQLQAVLDAIPDAHPLGAVIHAAGVLEDAVIETLNPERLQRVMTPKVNAAWNLHKLTETTELSSFVLFSSAAGLLGGPGQANYAAANAFLDALAHHRSACGLPGQSLAWGLWEQESGMADKLNAAELARFRQQIRGRLGFMAMSSDRGLALFDAAQQVREPLVAPVEFARVALQAQASRNTLPPILRAIVRTVARRGHTASQAARLAALPQDERKRAVLAIVLSEAAATLGHAAGTQIAPEKAFADVGFESLTGVELSQRLNAVTGLRLPASLPFDYPTPADVAELISTTIAGNGPSRAAIDEQLDTLEAMFADIAHDDRARRHADARLRRLSALARSHVTTTPNGHAASDEASSDSDLAARSEEELFQLIDDELGAP
jgi:acyl transferase domain-containing protein/NADP-dependent 3-hydroxy acid dehydrogenase YdfG/acyl carrier protein